MKREAEAAERHASGAWEGVRRAWRSHLILVDDHCRWLAAPAPAISQSSSHEKSRRRKGSSAGSVVYS
ncbi:hypothetical protein PLANPX_4302 [Lacipirellula parvula]|uniref:Uncharacterized protein n=1 Tax=Lacipirellula parvula TaxID=2650471 RepID=A0A5K7XCZ3_9BACT|nr:hypothetical protein PLANPX_4302 [Lacipirellula parvula]